MKSDALSLAPQRKLTGWQAFTRNRLAMISLGFILLLTALAILAPLIAKSPTQIEMRRTVGTQTLNPPFGPGLLNWLGTDQLGRDIYARILFGLRTSLLVGVIVRGATMVVGVMIGLVSGFFPGPVDSVIMRITDVMLVFPVLLLAMTVTAILGPGLATVCFALVLVAWPDVARLIRGQVLIIRKQAYVEAAQSIGARNSRIIFRHILPNCLGVIVVAFSMGIPGAIMYEAGLSFFGYGIQPPTPSLGSLIANGRGYMLNAPWYPGFPGLVLALLVLSFNLLGDAIIDAFDPREK